MQRATFRLKSDQRKWPVIFAAAALALSLAGCKQNPARELTSERWYGVFLQGAKVGHSTTRTFRLTEDSETLLETETSTVIETAKGADTVKMQMVETSVETPDGILRRFTTSTDSGGSTVEVSGQVVDNVLKITDSARGDRNLALPPDCLGFNGWEKILATSPPAEGEARRFQALDQTFLVALPQELVGLKPEALQDTSSSQGEDSQPRRRFLHHTTLPGGQKRTLEIWTDPDGVCVRMREDGLDMELRLMSPDEAKAPAERGLNLLTDTLAKLDRPFAGARQTVWARYRIRTEKSAPKSLFASGVSQSVIHVDEHTADIVVRAISPRTNLASTVDGASFITEQKPGTASLLSNSVITSDSPAVKQLAAEVPSAEQDAWRVATALERQVNARIKKVDYSRAFLTAAEAATTGQGDCSEFAVLLAAALRARNIPSRVAIGLVYVEGPPAMGYHMWTEAWINDRWIPLDAAFPQAGCAADRIKVAATNLEHGMADPSLLALGQLLGAKPKIEVIKSQTDGP